MNLKLVLVKLMINKTRGGSVELDNREEVKEITKEAIDKIDRRWYITQVLIALGLVGNAIAIVI